MQFVGRTHVHTDCVGQQLYTARAARVAHMRDPLAADRARDGVHRVRGATSRPKNPTLAPLGTVPAVPRPLCKPRPQLHFIPTIWGTVPGRLPRLHPSALSTDSPRSRGVCAVCVCVHFQPAKTDHSLFLNSSSARRNRDTDCGVIKICAWIP